MAKWRVAYSLNTLLEEINARWPQRSKASDGSIGDAAHASRKSDHNPWLQIGGIGIVRARDFTANGIDADWLAEHLRTLGSLGDKRLVSEGYVIWNKQIAGAGSTAARWQWRKYSGSNSHTKHIHLSVTETSGSVGFDSIKSWGLDGSYALQPTNVSVFTLGDRGAGVTFIQTALNWLDIYRLPITGKGIGAQIAVTGIYNKQTATAVIEFQRWNNQFLRLLGHKPNIKEDGITGPATLKLMSDWTQIRFGKK